MNVEKIRYVANKMMLVVCYYVCQLVWLLKFVHVFGIKTNIFDNFI